jgi:hypothetical protein
MQNWESDEICMGRTREKERILHLLRLVRRDILTNIQKNKDYNCNDCLDGLERLIG